MRDHGVRPGFTLLAGDSALQVGRDAGPRQNVGGAGRVASGRGDDGYAVVLGVGPAPGKVGDDVGCSAAHRCLTRLIDRVELVRCMLQAEVELHGGRFRLRLQ